jgi:cytochrome c oxidase subunit 4
LKTMTAETEGKLPAGEKADKEGKLLNAGLALLALAALGLAGWTAGVSQLRGGIDDLFLILMSLLVALVASLNPIIALYKKGFFTVEDEPEPAAGHGEHEFAGSNRLFLTVWTALLVLTGIEVLLAYEQVALLIMLTVLIGASVIKAVLIMAYFMHLRFERLSLILTLVPALVMCICLMLIIFPDSQRAHDLRPQSPAPAATESEAR